MGKNKNVEVNKHELKCCGILIPVDAKLYESAQIIDGKPVMGEELKTFMGTIRELGEKYEYVGLQVLRGCVIAIFKDEEKEKSQKFCEELKQKGIESSPINKPAYVDSRYLEGIYKGVQVKLPPEYLEKEIVDILDEYCFDWEYTTDVQADIIAYVGNLGGGRELHILVQHGEGRLACGMNNGTLRTTDKVFKHYKELFSALKDELKEWCDSHPSVCKLGARA